MQDFHDMAGKIELLVERMDKLPPADQKFAGSLVSAYRRHESLTEKQAYWLYRLVHKVDPSKPDPVVHKLGDMPKLYALFAAAKKRIMYPKMMFTTPFGMVMLSLAGSKSHYAGSVNVTNGGPFGLNVWYGRISSTGIYTPAPNVDPETGAKVLTFLSKLASDPEHEVAESGRMMGYCCFCGSKLSDEKSLSAGFGPTCAKTFGLLSKWNEPVTESFVQSIAEEVKEQRLEDNPYYRASRGY